MLIQKIESIIQTLKNPITSDEQEAGWTQSIKEGYIIYFVNLLIDVRNGKEIPYVGLVRSLDAYGIKRGGCLYEQAMEIARELNAKSG